MAKKVAKGTEKGGEVLKATEEAQVPPEATEGTPGDGPGAGAPVSWASAEVRKVPISLLKKAPWNYKAEDEFIQGKLSENIRRNGQLETLLVRKLPDGGFEVVNGNHRLTSLVALGMKEALVLDLGTISDSEAKRLAIELNETRFPSDMTRLSQILVELKKDFSDSDLLRTLPYGQREWDRISAYVDWDWRAPVPDLEKKHTKIDAQAKSATELLTFTGEQLEEFRKLLRDLKERSGRSTEALVVEGLRLLVQGGSTGSPVSLP